MPRIFYNIEKELLPALQETIKLSDRADFCVGYFNLRGWRQIDSFIKGWSGEDGNCCRLLVGMQRAVEQDLRQWLGLASRDEGIETQSALKFKKQLAAEFRQQLTSGAPTDVDEAGLRRLATPAGPGGGFSELSVALPDDFAAGFVLGFPIRAGDSRRSLGSATGRIFWGLQTGSYQQVHRSAVCLQVAMQDLTPCSVDPVFCLLVRPISPTALAIRVIRANIVAEWLFELLPSRGRATKKRDD
ncbi:MAG: hypothetical protein WD823_04650 [Sulfuricaulis sp.]|uniref:hypothetical protein n=1 Tax=Sulfuricaulis sp. TaxID=2003553 RepID=UPI0034A59E93